MNRDLGVGVGQRGRTFLRVVPLDVFTAEQLLASGWWRVGLGGTMTVGLPPTASGASANAEDVSYSVGQGLGAYFGVECGRTGSLPVISVG
jgi:hypothetical protein